MGQKQTSTKFMSAGQKKDMPIKKPSHGWKQEINYGKTI